MRPSPLLDCIAQYAMIPPKSTLFLGVSGGADSIYLLHRLYQLQDALDFTLVALHLNHQLRGDESQRDEDFVRSFVAKFCPGVPLFVEVAPVAQLAAAQKLGMEEMARQCRYDFFQKYAHTVEHSRIVTAHTADDNGETLVMNLTRGAGLRGLAGIPPVRENIIRPLLTTTRREILDYLALYSLPHVEDSSNTDLSYTRNRLRHQVMPLLLEQNPNLLQNISALTPIFREEDEILNQLALESLPPVTQCEGGISLSASGLSALPRPLALRGIQLLMERLDATLVLERSQREAILALCLGERPSASVDLPRGITARREYENLVFTSTMATALEEMTLPLPCDVVIGNYHITATSDIYQGGGDPWDFWIGAEFAPLTLRSRSVGDRLQRPNRRDKTLKSLMIDEKLPRHLRDGVPVLCAGGQIVAVCHLGVAQSALPQIGQPGWHITVEKIA